MLILYMHTKIYIVVCIMYFSVTTTTQPSDVAVPSGGTAVFTCVVDLRDRNANTDDIKWDSMGNAITRASTDPYMVENDFEEGDQLISTLTIKNVNTQHAGLYQFVLSLNDCDVMSREAFLTILTGRKILHLFLFVLVQIVLKINGQYLCLQTNVYCLPVSSIVL